jgi:hypothetical protein
VRGGDEGEVVKRRRVKRGRGKGTHALKDSVDCEKV